MRRSLVDPTKRSLAAFWKLQHILATPFHDGTFVFIE